MKRKLVRQGNNALTITVPRQWIDCYSLEAGDEIIIEEQGNMLQLTAKAQQTQKKISVNLDQIREFIPKYIHCLYRQGASEIVFTYSRHELLDEVYKVLNDDIIGYEIVDQTKDSIRIKSIAEITEDNFDSAFRRIFHINNLLLDSLKQIVREDDRASIDSAINYEKLTNKLTNFCRRMITLRRYDKKDSLILYSVLEILERTADEIGYILLMLKTKKVRNPRIRALVDEASAFFSVAEKAFFSDNYAEAARESVKRKHLIEDNLDLKDEAAHYLLNIIQNTVRILSYRLEIYISESYV